MITSEWVKDLTTEELRNVLEENDKVYGIEEFWMRARRWVMRELERREDEGRGNGTQS